MRSWPPCPAYTRRLLQGFARGLLTLLTFLAVPDACAHKTSDSYLRLRLEGVEATGQWFLALHDLEFAIGIDGNEDGAITWGELKARRAEILQYARERLVIEQSGAVLVPQYDAELQVDQLGNGGYAVLRLMSVPGMQPGDFDLEYRPFFDIDRLHRGFVMVEQDGRVQQTVFGPLTTRQKFQGDAPRPWREFGRFVREGVWHIWEGYDHLLFLLVLLMPAVLVLDRGRWVPVGGFGEAFVAVVKIVTAFTLTHSLTLSLAALGWVRLPSRWVEPAIAASIVVAAANNARPMVWERGWAIAFGFGLIHGFGFASVLDELHLPRRSLVRALVGFNLGVELGQLVVVAAFLPLAHGLRRAGFYRGWILRWGSVGAALLAAWWMVERLRTS
ncbi:MAG: HupE/UreJ family protein [Verrucomicrobiales bacterium]|nr:HupE/UreJ family protein [Verrucomicrobiales bacterium]